jgi:Sulfatase
MNVPKFHPQARPRIAGLAPRDDRKLTPPPELSPQQRQQWLSVKPTEVEVERDGVKKTLTGKVLEDFKYRRYMQDYLACVQSVDDNVGRLLDWLDANRLRENTVVIYTSDKGFFLGEHGLFDKRFIYEESVRMPFLVRWPGAKKPGSVAIEPESVSGAIGINCDFAPHSSTSLRSRFLPICRGAATSPSGKATRPGIGAARCTRILHSGATMAHLPD